MLAPPTNPVMTRPSMCPSDHVKAHRQLLLSTSQAPAVAAPIPPRLVTTTRQAPANSDRRSAYQVDIARQANRRPLPIGPSLFDIHDTGHRDAAPLRFNPRRRPFCETHLNRSRLHLPTRHPVSKASLREPTLHESTRLLQTRRYGSTTAPATTGRSGSTLHASLRLHAACHVFAP